MLDLGLGLAIHFKYWLKCLKRMLVFKGCLLVQMRDSLTVYSSYPHAAVNIPNQNVNNYSQPEKWPYGNTSLVIKQANKQNRNSLLINEL